MFVKQILLILTLFQFLISQGQSDTLNSNEIDSLLFNGYLKLKATQIDSSKYLLNELGTPLKAFNIQFQDDKSLQLLNQKTLEKYHSNKKFKAIEIDRLLNEILLKINNQGYPFANIKPYANINKNTLSLILSIERGPRYNLRELVIDGDEKFSEKQIKQVFELKDGEPYSNKMVENLKSPPQNRIFVNAKPPEIQFNKDSTFDVYLYLTAKKGSNFNGMIGLESSQNSEFNVSGMLTLELANLFKKGEYIYLDWNKNQTSSQNLDIKVDLPYFIGTSLNPGFEFSFFKQDTTFYRLKVNPTLGFHVGNTIFTLDYSFFTSKGNSFTETTSDYSKNQIGLKFQTAILDYPQNPYKGYYVHIGSNIQLLRSNEAINNKPMLGAEYHIGGYLPLFPKNTIHFSTRGKGSFGRSQLLNEMTYIGGLNSLRGINQNSIPTTFYNTFTLEYRFLFDRESALLVFSDLNYNEAYYINSYSHNWFISFGAGLNFNTKAGTFALYYALGKNFQDDLQFKNGKIHLGYHINF